MRRAFLTGLAVLTASVLLVSCTPGAEDVARVALADDVVEVGELFAIALAKSSVTAADALSERAFDELGNDFRQLTANELVYLPGPPTRGIIQSAIEGRDASVVMLLTTRHETGGGHFYESSYAYTCVRLTGAFEPGPKVATADADCGVGLEEKLTEEAWDRFSADELR